MKELKVGSKYIINKMCGFYNEESEWIDLNKGEIILLNDIIENNEEELWYMILTNSSEIEIRLSKEEVEEII